MKAKEFRAFLESFANLLHHAGARPKAEAWRALLPILQTRPDDKVSSVCVMLATLVPEKSSGVPSVGDAIELVPAMKGCLGMHSKKELLDDLETFAQLLRPFANLAANGYASAAAASLSADPVQKYLKQLEESLGNEDAFTRILSALKTDSVIKAPQAKKLAKAFTDYTAGSKQHAFQLIEDRHTALVVGLKKERATGGRGAA